MLEINLSSFANLSIGLLAIAVGALFWALQPPSNIREVPSANMLKFYWYVLTKKSRTDIHQDIFAPAFAKSKYKAIRFLLFARWIVIFSDASVAKKMFLDTTTFKKFDVTKYMKGTLNAQLLGDSLVFKNGQEWRSHRQVVNPAFHRSWPTDVFGNVAKEMIGVLTQMPKGPVKVDGVLHRATLDALGRIAFEYDFGALRDEKNESYELYKKVLAVLQSPIRIVFPMFEKLPYPHKAQNFRNVSQFNKSIDDVVERKLRQGIERKEAGSQLTMEEKANSDLLTLMVEAKVNKGGEATEKEFHDNIVLFYLAGHETTANALAFIMMELARAPEIQQLAREEAIKILGDEPKDIMPTFEQAKSLKYIDQIIKESQRKNPIVNIIVRDLSKPVEVNGLVLEPGVFPGLYVYGIHHNEQYYDEPDSFNPKRFDDESEDNRKRVPFSWIPFGGGSRQCLGMNFSIIEQRVFLSMILRKFTLELPKDSPYKNAIPSTTINIVAPRDLAINFIPRY
ncbi:hypothetical protein H4219_002121 [Mycoemilia scoparia]|uniref:Cytochrome P450 n=1 Tax=Mycoemilia scoparia TaxID=417184 RepID=A0A9W8A380_9FUNG|nr:hypothetical protein H4219_002121 [Mycoemilia scoparia]